MGKESLGWISTDILPPLSSLPFDQLPSVGVGEKGSIAPDLRFVHNHYLLPNPVFHRYWANLDKGIQGDILILLPANPAPAHR